MVGSFSAFGSRNRLGLGLGCLSSVSWYDVRPSTVNLFLNTPPDWRVDLFLIMVILENAAIHHFLLITVLPPEALERSCHILPC